MFADFTKDSEENITLTMFCVKGYNNNLISAPSNARVTVRNSGAHWLGRVEFGLTIL